MQVDKITDILAKVLPPELGKELKAEVATVVSRQLQDMGVVTREQFDIQKKVLQKTRAKLDLLEAKLQALEK